jgi:SAM-dependent methyltransferase
MEQSLPPPPGFRETPQWTGRAFQIGEVSRRILTYDVQAAGWSDELNHLLDDNGGEDHYMNVASRRNTARALGRWLTKPQPKIVEIGCGSGFTLQLLHQTFTKATLIGVDPFEEALNTVAHKLPDVPLLQFDLVNCPLPDRFADGVVILNVLEHLEDDDAAIYQVFRILRPGGVACIEVPAGPSLFDLYDRTLRHHRRYRMRELTAKLGGVGFEVVERSHLGFFVFPAFWAVKKLNLRYDRLPVEQQKARVLENIKSSGNYMLMHLLMTAENWLRRHVYFPLGIRCFVVCRRRA